MLQAIPIKMIIAVAIMVGAFFVGFKAGNDSCKASQIKAVEKVDQLEKEKIITVIKWKERQKVVYRDRIKVIKQAPKNECLDADLRDIGLGGMLKHGSSETQSGTVNTT